MDISLIIKIAGVGVVVTAVCQMLKAAGRDEQATYVSIAGILVVLLVLIEEMGVLFEMIKDVFEF